MECLYTDLMGSCEQYLCFRIDAKLSDKVFGTEDQAAFVAYLSVCWLVLTVCVC